MKRSAMVAKSPKPKQCKLRSCGQTFVPDRMGQKICSPDCAYPFTIQQRQDEVEKQKRKENRAAKKKLRESDRSWWVKQAQIEFNKWIRLRDRHLPCVSCGKPAHEQHGGITGSVWDCGHYRSVGSCPELRFEPLNAAKQCVKCNRNLSGNVVEFRIELANRLGAEKMEWLEGPHREKKYSIADLKEIREKYKKLNKELERALASNV